MRRYLLLLGSVALATAGGWPAASRASGFDESDVLPTIREILFGPDAVGFVSTRKPLLGGAPLHFVYERADRTVREVGTAEFRERLPQSVPAEEPNRPEIPDRGFTAGGLPYTTKLKYCGEGQEDDDEEVSELRIDDRKVRIRALKKCSGVSTVEIVKERLWLGTAYFGEGGYGGGEGIIVQDLRGARVFARLKEVSGWVSHIRLDPFSGNVWAVSSHGIYEISPLARILGIHRYRYEFEPSSGEPRFAFSRGPVGGNPFATVARLLPQEDRKGFYEAVAGIPAADLDFDLDHLYMGCLNGSRHEPMVRQLMPFLAKTHELLCAPGS